MKQMVLLFKGIDPRRISDPGPQLRRVLKFRESIEKNKEFLYQHFDTLIELERCLRRFLAKWARDNEQPNARETPTTTPEVRKAVDESPTRREIGLARRAVSPGDAKAILDYSLFLMKTGRLWRARMVLEGALAQTKVNIGASIRQQVEAALEDALQQADLGSPVTGAKSESSSGDKFYIQRYLAGIAGSRAYALDPGAKNGQPEDQLDAADVRATRALISELQEIGQDFQKNGLLALAEEVYRRCLALASSINSSILTVQSLTDLTIVSSLKSDYPTAERFARRAVAACPGSREAMHTIASSNLGLILLENNSGAEGRELLEAAGPFWRERIKTDMLPRNPQNMGFVVATKDDPTVWKSEDHLAAAYAGLGLFHLYRGESAMAEKHHVEAYLVVGRYSAISPAILNNLGVIYHTLGDLRSSREHLDQALTAGARDVDGLNPVQSGFVARAQVTHNWSIVVAGTPQWDATRSAVAQELLDLGSRLATVRSTEESGL
jgi:tetratricopeptide (TPR) repeat protein